MQSEYIYIENQFIKKFKLENFKIVKYMRFFLIIWFILCKQEPVPEGPGML